VLVEEFLAPVVFKTSKGCKIQIPDRDGESHHRVFAQGEATINTPTV
jgi:hypothetical protein